MSKSSDELFAWYQQWLTLALTEQQVITERKWDALHSLSEKKQKIMDAVCDIESKNPSWKEEGSSALHLLIHKLADLEQLNQTLVQERHGEIKIQIDDINRRIRVVRQLHYKYQNRDRGLGQYVSQKA